MMKPQRGKTPKKPPRKGPAQTDPVEVYCRIRPLEKRDDETCLKIFSTTTIQLTPPEASHGMRTGNAKETQHTFKYVFDEYTSQKAVFDTVALPLVEDVLHGKNALLFAYGITSSGKTHTMNGTRTDQGVLPRCLDVLFNSIGDLQARKYVFKPDKMNGFDLQTEADAMMERQHRDIMPKLMNTPRTPATPRNVDRGDPSKQPRVRDPSQVEDVEEDNNYAVFVSYVEIYNNYMYDLLDELPYDTITGYKAPQSKILREDSYHNMYVSGVVEVEVKSTEEAYDVLWKGQKRRKVAHTALNTESSRSHSVFNVRLVQAPLDPAGEEVLQDKDRLVISQLSLVDLAGSERTDRTKNAGDRLREAGNINQSLMVLRTCIEALRENQTGGDRMVPYRDSRLTHLCKNYFDGEGKVRMVVCINPKADEYDETIHVMRFAELTQEVQVARPQQVRFDVGLTPGRRRLNQQYKEAVAKVYEEGGDPTGIAVPAPLIYSMGAGFPMLELKDPSDETVLLPLAEFLRNRENRRVTLLTDLAKKHDQFRSRLLEMERENTVLLQRVKELESTLNSKDSEYNRQQKRLKSLEKTNVVLTKATNEYETEKRLMEQEINQKEWKIHMEKTERDRLRQDYHAKLTLTEQQYNRQMDMQKRKLEEEAKAQIRAKQQKLDRVKTLLGGEESDASSSSSTYTSTPRVRSRTVTTSAYTRTPVTPARSEPDLTRSGTMISSIRPTVAPKPSVHQRATTYGSTIRSAASRARSPPPVKPKPAVNPRYHRRSRSHDVWLEHKPAGSNIIEKDTLLQPKIKKKKVPTATLR